MSRILSNPRNRTIAFNLILALSALAVVAGVSMLSGFGAIPDAHAACEKLTICHAAGQSGTTHFVEVTACRNAIIGQAGHFNEDGTPNAGHELDVFGPCESEDPTPEPTPEPTPDTN